GRVKYLVASAVAFNKPGALLPLAGPSTDDLMGRRQTLTERLDGAARSYATGSITENQLATITATLRSELDQIDTEIARAAPADAQDLHINQVEDMLQSDNITDLRKVLAYLGVEVVLHPKGRGNHRDKVHISQQVTVTINGKNAADLVKSPAHDRAAGDCPRHARPLASRADTNPRQPPNNRKEPKHDQQEALRSDLRARTAGHPS